MWNIKKIVRKGEYNYALVPDHPNCTKHGYVLEHRVVVENALGRLLNTNEVVHHKDGNKTNNCLDNLEVMTVEEHARAHRLVHGKVMAKLKCPWCGKIFIKPIVQTFLYRKNSKQRATYCSRSCNGQMSRFVQLHGITPELESAISGNLLTVYNTVDNPEETHSQEDP